MDLDIHEKFKPLYSLKKFYKVFWGSRGGMKTFEFSRALVLKASKKKLNIVCGRQFQESISESVKESIEEQIYLLGLEDEYRILEKRIIHKITKSVFKFKGLERNIKSKKGWNNVHILWIEEGEVLKATTIEILFPSIRKKGAEIWISMNRGKRSDPIDKMFLAKNLPKEIKDNSVIVKVGWRDNKHFPAELELQRQICLKVTPERYAHIWEGEPDDDPGANKVLQYEKLLQCVDAHKKVGYKPSGMCRSGLDVADEGNDTNAWAFRQEALLSIVREWKVKYLHMTAGKADFLNKTNNVATMHFDAGGLGAGMKSDLSRIKINPNTGAGPGVKKFIPFLFNGKVKGPSKFFIKHKELKIRNKDYFYRANSQAWWNIRLRVENTIKLLDGEKIDPGKCFFIDSRIDNLDDVLAELSQCVYDDSTGKIKIDKAPGDAPSPNLADAIVMAFAYDIKKGLKSS